MFLLGQKNIGTLPLLPPERSDHQKPQQRASFSCPRSFNATCHSPVMAQALMQEPNVKIVVDTGDGGICDKRSMASVLPTAMETGERKTGENKGRESLKWKKHFKVKGKGKREREREKQKTRCAKMKRKEKWSKIWCIYITILGCTYKNLDHFMNKSVACILQESSPRSGFNQSQGKKNIWSTDL